MNRLSAAVTFTLMTFSPSATLTWWPSAVPSASSRAVSSALRKATPAPESLVSGVMVTLVTEFSTATAYSVVSAAKLLMSTGLTARELRVASRAGEWNVPPEREIPTSPTWRPVPLGPHQTSTLLAKRSKGVV